MLLVHQQGCRDHQSSRQPWQTQGTKRMQVWDILASKFHTANCRGCHEAWGSFSFCTGTVRSRFLQTQLIPACSNTSQVFIFSIVVSASYLHSLHLPSLFKNKEIMITYSFLTCSTQNAPFLFCPSKKFSLVKNDHCKYSCLNSQVAKKVGNQEKTIKLKRTRHEAEFFNVSIILIFFYLNCVNLLQVVTIQSGSLCFLTYLQECDISYLKVL